MPSPSNQVLPIHWLPGCAFLLLTAALSGCGHHQRTPTAGNVGPPPLSRPASSGSPANASNSRSGGKPSPARIAPTPGEVTAEDTNFIARHQPVYSEEGVASWYGPPYHNHQGANGKVFDQNALTAAHRTLPMGSLIVVTNEKTGQAAAMRVTDRGPFVPGRVLDLSMGSAKVTGVYRAGLATVRIDVYQTPKPIEEGGRWCVQIGAFESEGKAVKLRKQLERKYESAQVIDFAGPTGHWVRIRPEGDNREQAELIQRKLKPSQGDAYLVRLD